MAETINKHSDLRASRMGDVRCRNLEVRGTSNLQGVTLTSVSGDTASFISISASAASFASMTASQANIDTLQVTNLITAASATNPLPGLVMQIVQDDYDAVNTGTATISEADVIPSATDGTLFMSATMTPVAIGNTLIVDIQALLASSVNSKVSGTIGYGTATAVRTAGITEMAAVNNSCTLRLSYRFQATATVSTVFNFRAGSNGVGTTTFNGDSGNRLFGAIVKSWIRIEEVYPVL